LFSGIIAFVGINTYSGLSGKIDRVTTDAEQRIKDKVNSTKVALDKLSSDVDVQTKRVAQKGGEISQKFQSLDATADAFSKRLDATVESLETKVAQVSKQADIASVRRAYPTLGEQRYITYNSQPWKGLAAKGVKERWINIYIDPLSTGDFLPGQIDTLAEELGKSGYTPLLGMFGIGGPYFGGYGALGASNETTVFYFQHESESMAKDVAAIASRILLKPVQARFVDLSVITNTEVAFVIKNSGLDLQLYLLRPQR